jgi:DNA-binding PadR family transcriptional regulator
MSSIRLFILAALEERGPQHGHQLRLLAEQEHVTLWTDITVGSLYGALKRLAAEELIEEVRVERAGAYPQRQVWAITDAGREALGGLRLTGLREVVIRPDPFDLALSRLDADHLDDVPSTVDARIATLTAMLAEWEAHAEAIERYLTAAEKFVLTHHAQRLRAEIAWHQYLAAQIKEIIADERSRRG